MTRDEIMNMPAGPEIDRLVAKIVMGYDITSNKKAAYKREPNGYSDLHFLKTRKYSIDIAAAWQVVEKFSTDPALANDVDIITTIRGWKCTIRTNKRDFISNADAAPLAICRAALLAVME